MRNPTLVAFTGAALLLSVAAEQADARRSRRRSQNERTPASSRYGGSAQRGQASGEALAQSFYERSVLLGKQGQYGQAKALMASVVRKNPSNDKYRYYLALLMYKTGDLEDSQNQVKKLANGSLERYRRKALGLQARIDDALRGDTPFVRPLRGRSLGRVGPDGMLPDSAYLNVADMAARMRNAKYPGVSRREEPSISPSTYRSMHGGSMAPPPPSAEVNSMPPNFAAGTGVTRASAMDPHNPLTAARGWVDPTNVPAPAPPQVRASRPVPAKPAAPQVAAKPPEPPPAANPFTDVGGEDDAWSDPEPTPAPPPTKAAPPPPTKAAPPPPATPEVEDDGFGDGFGDEGGFGEILDEADGKTPPAPTTEAEVSDDSDFGDGFGDGDGFDGDF